MLTDAQCRKLPDCPPDAKRPVRHSDFGGLYLQISPSGARVWYWKYRYKGQEKRLKIGAFPTVDVLSARMARDTARKTLETGVDPYAENKAQAERNLLAADATFEAVAKDFHATKKSSWSEVYADKWLSMMTNRLFPHLGRMAISQIKAPDLLKALKRTQDAGLHETAHSLRQWSGQVFRHAVAQGLCEHDIAHLLRDALTPVDVDSYAAVTKPDDLALLLEAIDRTPGSVGTCSMLQLAALTGQRPGNIRAAEWDHMDLDAALPVWLIPAHAMKLTKGAKKKRENDHYVPLSRQAVEVLRGMQAISGDRRYVFPGTVDKNKPASEATMNAALVRGGIPKDMHVPHGFRAMLLTMGQEQCGLKKAVLDAALAHGKDGPLGDTYDRAEFLKERREALQAWADYLDVVRAGDKVVPIKKKRRA